MTREILLLSRYGPRGASSRVRTYQYIDELERANFTVSRWPMFSDAYVSARQDPGGHTVLPAVEAYIRRIGHLLRMRRGAILWLEYELLPWLPFAFERAMLASAHAVVVDFDDAIFHRYDQHRNPWVRRVLGQKIDRIMRSATVVVAGNDYLAARARDAGARRIEIIPSVIDLRRYRQKRAFATDSFTVGWIGSPSTTEYLRALEPVVRAAADIPGIRLANVGGSPWMPQGIPTSTIPWSEDTEVAEVLEFDVGVMPLPDDPWTRGKCGYKLVQYMGCGLPVVASPVSANLRIVEQGRTGYFPATDAEWIDALRRLAASPTLRATLGHAGFEKARREYDLAVTAPRMVDLFEDVGRNAGRG